MKSITYNADYKQESTVDHIEEIKMKQLKTAIRLLTKISNITRVYI